jgi:hypothetical protein
MDSIPVRDDVGGVYAPAFSAAILVSNFILLGQHRARRSLVKDVGNEKSR